MKTPLFRGTGVALVTPFHADESIDEPRLRALVDRQIKEGVEALLPVGTTGEGATLSHEEHCRVMEIVVDQVAGRVPVIPGAGSNSTREAVMLSRCARAAGAQGVLSVTPYYNKPEPEGLLRHYATIAEQADIPIVLYNVPSRTGRNVPAEVTLQLAEEIPHLVAIKEASGNLEQMMEIITYRPEGFAVYSGDDALTLPLLAMGGDGVVSVVANQVPGLFSEMVRRALAGDMEGARVLHYRLLPLMEANFLETNPIPVKTTLAMMGLIEEVFRLPLTPPRPATREKLRTILEELELLRVEA